MPFKRLGQTVDITQDLIIGAGDDAITVPAGSLQNEATRTEYDIVWEADPIRADERFYWNGDIATPRPLADVLKVFWDQIKAHRDVLQEAGCKVGADWFHNDLKSRSQWERMANRSAGMADADPYLVGGQPVPWKTMGGSFVPLTAGKIRQVVEAFELREAAIFAKAEQHKAALAAKTTVEGMIAYNWLAGWPMSFYEEQSAAT